MTNNIPPDVLTFLKNLPNMPCSEKHTGTITEEDEARIKIMLNNATDPQAQVEREVLKRYILNSDFKDNTKITEADREAMAEYLRKYAPEFYRLICDTKDDH